MLTLHTTGQFRKDEKLARKRGLDVSLLKAVIQTNSAGRKAFRPKAQRSCACRKVCRVQGVSYSAELALDLYCR
jgi:hypothetical protein